MNDFSRRSRGNDLEVAAYSSTVSTIVGMVDEPRTDSELALEDEPDTSDLGVEIAKRKTVPAGLLGEDVAQISNLGLGLPRERD